MIWPIGTKRRGGATCPSGVGQTANRPNRRRSPRRRTRLRSGKLATIDNRFITECQIFDRSCEGARLRLAGRIRLPEVVKFYDDQNQELYVVRVVWQRGNEVGIFFPEGARVNDPKAISRLAGKYYAVNTWEGIWR